MSLSRMRCTICSLVSPSGTVSECRIALPTMSVSIASSMLARARNRNSPAFRVPRCRLRKAWSSNRKVWLMTPSRLSRVAISPVPMLFGTRTILSAASGPGSFACFSMKTTPTMSATAPTTTKVRSPERVESRPPRSLRMRGGGGGASIGFSASLGLRGDSRCAGPAAPSSGIEGSCFRLPKNITLPVRSAERASRSPGSPYDLLWRNGACGVASGGPRSRRAPEYERGVGAAEPEGVRQHDVDVALLRRVRHEVDRGLDRRVVEVDRRRRDPVAHGEDREDRLDRAGGAADEALDRLELDLVAERRRGAVGVDVVDVRDVDAGALDRHLHAAIGAVAVLGRRGDVVGIARQAVADHLGVDPGAPRLRVRVLLEHDDAGALAHDEAVAVAIVGARGAGRIVVEVRRQRPAGGKAGERKPVDRRFRAAGEHDLGVAIGDEPRGVADRVRAGRAGGHDGVVRALEPVLDRDVARGEVDEPTRDEERRDAPRALLVQRDRGVIDAADAADAGADENAGGILLVGGLRLPRRILQRLGRGGHRVDDERIDLALLLRLHPLVGIEAAVGAVAARDLAGDPAGEVGGLEALDLRAAAFTGEEPLPARLGAAAERRDHSDARDDDPPHRTTLIGPSGDADAGPGLRALRPHSSRGT